MEENFYLRSSSLSDYLNCPAKYYFGWIKKLEPVERSIDLEFGASMHLAAKMFFTELKKGKDFLCIIPTCLEFFLDDFNSRELDQHQSKNALVGSDVLTEFFLKFKDLNPENILKIEEVISKRIGGVDYKGKVDLLMKHGRKITVYDHKTSSWFKKNSFSKWELSRQLMGYQWLADADSVVVNYLHCVQESRDHKARVFQPPFYFSDLKIKLWEQQTAQNALELLERAGELERCLSISSPNTQFVPDILFPRMATVCQIFNCGFEPLCEQSALLPDIRIPNDMFKERDFDSEDYL